MEVSDGAAAATPPGVRHAHTLTPVTGRITIDVSKDAAKVAAANEKAWKVLPAGDYEEDA